MEASEPGFTLLIVKILIAKISNPLIQAVYVARINVYNCAIQMKEEKQHNLCDNLHSQDQTKNDEIRCLVAKISALTEKMSMILFRQQAYYERNKAFNATHSQKSDVELQELQETLQELADTKKMLKTVETLLADANKKNIQLEA